MAFRKYILFFAGFGCFGCALGQTDSLLLHPENLGERDIYVPMETNLKNIKIVSGSRFPVAAADLPFSTHVITREEIRTNGYETLVDALKMAPGIRVSQPGSAVDGETFLMRGLLGNTYAKILINDVPVKPAFVASMPIGAQLPVKEAERIEIIYGAGAALYGSDAAAGVINIITRESDRPVYMQADLSVGGGIYSSANVMFGGRLGKDKRIFRYFAYGSNVLFENRNIFYDQDYNYNPTTYERPDTNYANSNIFKNYAGTASKPVLTNTPHLSRKFGFNIKYKRLTLSGETMYRRDHSSLGYNPAALSYRNPQTFTGESILKFNLNIFKEREKRNRKTDLTYIRYNLDTRSSNLLVQNKFAQMLGESSEAQAKTDTSNTALGYFLNLYNRYIDGIRYQFGKSDEFRMEHVRNYRLFKYISLTLGANFKYAVGYPFTNYLSRPAATRDNNFIGFQNDFILDPETFPILPKKKELYEGNGFGQLFYNGEKFNVAAGVNYAAYLPNLDEVANLGFIDNFSPRLSGLWNLTESVNIRSTWGRAFRAPNAYYQGTSYAIQSDNKPIVRRPDAPIFPEKTTSWENGIRWKADNGDIGADLTWFLSKTSRLLRYNSREFSMSGDSTYLGLLGYSNFDNTTIRYTGGQFSMFFKTKNLVDGILSYSWLNYKKADLNTLETFAIRPPKGSIFQFRQSFSPFKDSKVIFDLIRYKDIARKGGEKADNKFWTCDLVWLYNFTDRFSCYLKIINLFNQEYSGILPEGDPGDLLHYNPQSGFFLRLGMNYYIE
jgi:outer membrane cobalamin receptor